MRKRPSQAAIRKAAKHEVMAQNYEWQMWLVLFENVWGK